MRAESGFSSAERGITSTPMICREINWRSPYAAFAPLAGKAHAHLLHGGDLSATAEWSAIVAFPADLLILETGDAEGWLRKAQAVIDARAVSDCDLPRGAPFGSGLVGYLGYEALAPLEPSLALPKSPYPFPDAVFGVYDAAAIFSRRVKKAWITGRSETVCRALEDALGEEAPAPAAPPAFSALSSNFSRNAYEAAVSDVIERILNGDFYQANIAQHLATASDDAFSPFDLFRFIAGTSDAFFGALLQYENGAVLSNSPERFFRLARREGVRKIVAEPIKGTRRRALDDAEDAALAQELVNDPKDRAENVMIADLMRNDLSKICEDGSIREDAICELMTLSRVHHLVSRVSGVLRDDVAVTDVFRALFPSGSITGAPKIEAMKAIAEIEGVGRGPYCGAIGYVDDRGGADFSVAIRTMTATKENRRLSIPVGGGVTLRSKPAEEYEETLVKAVGAISAASGLVKTLS